jgi:hypothetical protein
VSKFFMLYPRREAFSESCSTLVLFVSKWMRLTISSMASALCLSWQDPASHVTFFLLILVNECASLQPPKNGYFDNNCDDWHVGNTCEPKCNDGYAFFSHQANTSYRYQCTQQGQWTPAPNTMPDCYGELSLIFWYRLVVWDPDYIVMLVQN